jgi:hypothetical protein
MTVFHHHISFPFFAQLSLIAQENKDESNYERCHTRREKKSELQVTHITNFRYQQAKMSVPKIRVPSSDMPL